MWMPDIRFFNVFRWPRSWCAFIYSNAPHRLLHLLPVLRTFFPNLTDYSERIIYEQDGTSSHFALIEYHNLVESLGSSWISRLDTVAWQPSSSDLTSFYFFLWGYIKYRVLNNLSTISELIKASELRPVLLLKKLFKSTRRYVVPYTLRLL